MPLVSDRFLLKSLHDAFGFEGGDYKETASARSNYASLEVLPDEVCKKVKEFFIQRPRDLRAADLPPEDYSGNRKVYQALEVFVDHIDDVDDDDKLINAAATFTQLRNSHNLNLKSDALKLSSPEGSMYKKLIILAKEMDKLSTISYRIFRENIKASAKKVLIPEVYEALSERQRVEYDNTVLREPVGNGKYMKLYSFGAIYLLRVFGEDIFLTGLHLKRVISLLKSMSLVVMSLRSMPLKCSATQAFKQVFFMIFQMSSANPEAVGRWIKGARTLFVASLADDEILGESTYDLMKSDFDPQRALWSEKFLRTVNMLTSSIFTKQFLTELYKFIPHPDSNMHKLFDSLYGLREPNRPTNTFIRRFNGVMRRSIFRSLSKSGMEVRLTDIDDVSSSLVNLVNSTSADPNKASQYGSHVWSYTRFELCRQLVPPKDIVVKPHNKASAIYDGDEFPRDGVSGVELIREHLGNINDLTSVLTNTSSFGKEKAIKRFEEIIRAHEELERDYLEPEDIDSRVLESFVYKNENARTVTSTEPKYGEYHKEVTRMFYMAEQQIKELTQSVERLARQISRKQSGVSIVKSYYARRSDLENFARSMLPADSDVTPVFVSFDMSEFSKKFPMKLLRNYGDMLAELTGENWLRRLDLFFRSAVVCHNTRGYTNYMSGVKGGFEGFLNFVWSSIHAAIMETALEVTGVRGELLAFSDDGLLMFYVDSDTTKEEKAEIVHKIKEIYSNLGLEFKLQKTMVSEKVWEYLGDICYDGSIIGSFSKELSTMFKEEEPVAISNPVDRINTLSSKVKAGIKKGMDPLLGSLSLAIESIKILQVYLSVSDPSTVLPLLIIPNAYGGARIPSMLELSTEVMIEEYSEMIADFMIMGAYLPVKKIMFILASRRMSGIDSIKRSLTGGRFNVKLESTSTNKTLDYVLEAVMEKYPIKVPKNPLDEQKKKGIVKIIKEFQNVNPLLVTRTVMSTPQWKEYSNTIAFVKSKSVQRLLTRREIADVQRRVDSSYRRILRWWINEYRSHSTENMRIDRFIDLTVNPQRGLYSPPKISPRILLQRTNRSEGMQYTTIISLSNPRTIYDTSFMERGLKSPDNYTDLAWYSESGSEFSDIRKVMRIVAGLLAESPEVMPLLKGIYSCFGLNLPSVPNSVVSNFARKTSAKGTWTEADSYGPSPFINSANTIPNRELFDYYQSVERADRSSYLECARSLSSIIAKLESSPNVIEFTGVYKFRVNESLIEMAIPNQRMETEYKADLTWLEEKSNIPEPVMREFLNSLNETAAYINRTQSAYELIESNDNLTEDERRLFVEITKSRMKQFLEMLYRSRSYSQQEARTLPVPRICRDEIFSESLVMATLSLMDPLLKTKLESTLYAPLIFQASQIEGKESTGLVRPMDINLDQFNSLEGLTLDEDKEASIDEDEFEDIEMSYYKSAKIGAYSEESKESPIFSKYEKLEDQSGIVQAELNFIEIYNALLKSLIAGTSAIDDLSFIPPIRVITEDVARIIRKHIVGSIAVEGLMKPRIIIHTPTYPESKITPSHKGAFKEILSTTLTAMRAELRRCSYDAVRLRERFGIRYRGDLDELMDGMICMRACLRPSKHRSIASPFNKRTFTIEMYKHLRTIEKVYALAKRHRDDDQKAGKTPNEQLAKTRLKERLGSVSLSFLYAYSPLSAKDKKILKDEIKRDNSQSGEDHMRMLESQPLGSLWYRYKQYYSLAYLRINPIFVVSVHNIRNLMSAIYSSFLSNAISNMRTITVSEAEIRDGYAKQDISRFVPVFANNEESTFISRIRSKWDDIVRNEYDDQIIELLLQESVYRGFLIEVDLSRCTTETMLALKSYKTIGMSNNSGSSVSFNNDLKEADLYLYHIRDDDRSLISTFLNMKSDTIISSSLYSDNGESTLMCITTKRIEPDTWGNLRSDETVLEVLKILRRPAIAAHSDLKKSLAEKNVSIKDASPFPTLSQLSVSFSRYYGDSSMRVEDAAELTMAYELLKSEPSLAEQVVAYSMIDRYTRRKSNSYKESRGEPPDPLPKFGTVVSDYVRILSNVSDKEYHDLNLDISYISAWILRVRPMPKTNKDEEELSKTLGTIRMNFLRDPDGRKKTLGEPIMSHINAFDVVFPEEITEYSRLSLWKNLFRARSSLTIEPAEAVISFDVDFDF